ncbi:hypothetical protein J8F10_11055 [Gemmata sp. G18]|uniref:Carboxypeptidase regulatory-like domain-containing protein n=1 Tax=Gemmata palustris TaxID=2822762 RepID=A0ABS5BQ10_9BACT|nr:hypothetical protein [Gemmata palustris]MBP3955822.1 hypothetical protein [Gemmata palustris]
MRIHLRISRPSFFAVLVAACALSSSGCGGGEKIISVSGTVTHKGQPVSGIVVSFVPEGATEAGVSTGTTDENGKYELTVVKSNRKGAVAGKHKVWFSVPREPFVEPADKEELAKQKKDKKATKPPPDFAAILKVYGNLDKTPLTVEVKDGGQFDLKLD